MKRGEIQRVVIRLMLLAPITAVVFVVIGCDKATPSHSNSWLSYGFSKNGCNGCADLTDQSEEVNYYCTVADIGGNAPGGVDPTNCNQGIPPTLTLDQWKQDNGFPANGYPDAHAIYANLGDLRVGRDMNCVQSAQKIACYVSNVSAVPYDPNQISGTDCSWAGCDGGGIRYDFPDVGFYIKALINHPGALGFATVAMVYNPAAAANQVTFYAFDSRGDLLTSGNQLANPNSPALDGEGPKTNPRMCMACHGGNYDTTAHTATLTRFLPFDVYYFQFAEDAGYTLDDQQEGLRQLNDLVKRTNATQPIKDFIDATYPGGVSNPGSTAVDGYVPAGWGGHENLYTSVVRQYCRMCHLAQGNSFNTYQQFQAVAQDIEDHVCNKHDMPNAQVPFGRFWVHDKVAQSDLRDFLKGEGITNLHDCQ